MAIDDQGFPEPPQIGSATNQEHQVQANAMYSAAKAGDWDTLGKLANKPSEKFGKLGGTAASGINGMPGAQPNWPTNETKGGPLNTQDKWTLQKVQYAQALIDAKGTATNLTAKVDAITGPADLSMYKKMGARSAAAIRLASTKRTVRSYVKGTKASQSESGGVPTDDRPKARLVACGSKRAWG